MTQISSENIQHLLERFFRFDDAVIRNVQIKTPEGAVVEVSARDSETEGQHDWVNVRFLFGKIVEYRYEQDEISSRYKVMSSGLLAMENGRNFYLDFAPYTHAPSSLEDFRKSMCMIASDSIRLSVIPYAE